MPTSVLKQQLYRDLGYDGSLDAIEQILAAANLTNASKTRISVDKHDAVESVLRAKLLRVCSRGDCKVEAGRILAKDAERQEVRSVSQEHCDICGGSKIRSAFAAMLEACERAGWTRLCVVGGSPTARARLEAEASGRIALRLIDGTQSRSKQDAKSDIAWADHCVIWGPTQLLHKVSNLYQGEQKCTTTNRRGIEDLVDHLREAAVKR